MHVHYSNRVRNILRILKTHMLETVIANNEAKQPTRFEMPIRSRMTSYACFKSSSPAVLIWSIQIPWHRYIYACRRCGGVGQGGAQVESVQTDGGWDGERPGRDRALQFRRELKIAWARARRMHPYHQVSGTRTGAVLYITRVLEIWMFLKLTVVLLSG
jgi:hypothetical protein